ncbi:hypothetical protein EDC02_3615 [Micromonospora sp. Llam0]|uniref:hypothetical protein n=1 Tax=Micromonospora sp. Llam0 TaxID=2485143 RepID=UPI000FAA66E4|nr:hypothetical protein [Micromonospora sp. Llam0]ROO61665.1 hypothetical protein EDC02_3615 [Micromonospora sp. Llam0]
MSTGRRAPLFAAGSLLLVFFVAVLLVCLLGLSVVVAELRKDPLLRAAEQSVSERAQRLSRKLSMSRVDDPPAGHTAQIVAVIEGRERTELGLAGRVYLVDVDDDDGRVEAIVDEYVPSGGGWFSDGGEVSVCVRWDVHRKSAVYSDITAKTIPCP